MSRAASALRRGRSSRLVPRPVLAALALGVGLGLLAAIDACAPARPVVTGPAPAPAGASAPELGARLAPNERALREAAAAALLDDWHAAAARADEEAYFAAIAPEGVFLGTDASERWEKEAFRAYAHPHFARGKAWSFRATARHLALDARGELAWFDEALATEKLGPARGSGVLVWREGGFRIAQYNLSIPIPNERFAAVHALIAGAASDAPPAASGSVPAPASSGSTGSVTSALSSSPGACASLEATLAAAEKRYAAQPASCLNDADCACYGGPVCPNALVRTCPAPVAASVSRALEPLVSAHVAAGCQGFLWSPYGCHAACVAGRCVSSP